MHPAAESELSPHGDWLDLAGRVCVVTGAGSGIGAGAAQALAQAGCRVAVLDRQDAAAQAVAAKINAAGGEALPVDADVADPVSVAAAAARVQRELGLCQVLVNNAAAQATPTPLMELQLHDWNAVLAVNLTGALLCAQAFGAQMIAGARGGAIINVASVGADHAWVNSAAYGVGKAGLVLLTRQIALELAPHGIRCNAIKPGLVRTPATRHLYADADIVRRREQIIPAGRISRPLDLANVITFLASDRSDYINGEDLAVDGGVSRVLMSLIPRPEPRQ